MVEPTLKGAAVARLPGLPRPASTFAGSMRRGLCVGCRRTLGEIAEWSRASDARRLEILRALHSASDGATGGRAA